MLAVFLITGVGCPDNHIDLSTNLAQRGYNVRSLGIFQDQAEHVFILVSS